MAIVTVKAGTTVLGTIPTSGVQFGVPFYLQGNIQPLYRYANLALPYTPNDPGLLYTYQNPGSVPHVTLAVKFFNLLNEPSTSVLIDVGSALAPSGANIVAECLDVRNFGAVGDGVTNDTQAIQCALDQAAKNWNAQQTAIAQKKPLSSPGSTIVCIPAGFTFAVGGNFWASACGRAWAPTNWPVNPYDVAKANVPYYDSFSGKTLALDAALFVRSGVTVQLDGTLLRIEPEVIGNFESTTVLCVFDDQVASFQASNVTIKGTGTIDDNGLTYIAGLPGGIATSPSGDCIFATISSNFSVQTITLKSALRWGIELFATPTAAFPTLQGFNLIPTAPTVFTDAALSNSSITDVTFSNCGLQGLQSASFTGGVFIVGSQVSVTDCTFSSCGNATVWFNGKQINVSGNSFSNCAGNPAFFGSQYVIIVGLSNSCSVTNNTIQGGGTYQTLGGGYVDQNGNPPPVGQPTTLSAAIRIFNNLTPLKIKKATDIPSPMYPIDYTYNVVVTGNTISNFGGRGIYADPLTNFTGVTGYYSMLSINGNSIDGCTGFGIFYQPTIYPFVPPCGTLYMDGLNWACSIMDNNLGTNGLGEGVSPIQMFNWQAATTYTSVSNPTPQRFGLVQQYSIAAQIWGPASATTNFGNNLGPLKCCPLTNTCVFNVDAGIFTGPYLAFPYPNLSYGGAQTGMSDGQGAVVVSSSSAQNYKLMQSNNETPGGAVDGHNTTFTLAHPPYPAHSVFVTLTQTQSLSVTQGTISPTSITSSKLLSLFGDYGINGNVITLNVAPPQFSTLAVSYTWLPVQPH